jgi:hypothetical protein
MAAATDDIQNDEKKAQEILAEKLGAPVVPENTVATDEDDIEKIVGHKNWTFEAEYDINFRGEMKTEIFKRTYTQKPLSYHAFGEFTGLIGRKLAEAMRGPDGLSLDKLTPGGASLPLEYSEGKISLADTGSDLIDPIIQGIAKLAEYVPDLMGEAQCIWLRVPRSERGLLIDIWSRPVDEGGMSMDAGEEMLEIFIEQNYDELNGFLKRYARVKNVVQKMRKRVNLSEG